jgi:hypothetical protein
VTLLDYPHHQIIFGIFWPALLGLGYRNMPIKGNKKNSSIFLMQK